VRPEALSLGHISTAEITNDLTTSRDHGLAHTEDLVQQWTPRIAVPAETIRHYLTENIHYTLTADCIEAMKLFRHYAAEIDALPPLPELRFL
jgi:chorismate dehydratase